MFAVLAITNRDVKNISYKSYMDTMLSFLSSKNGCMFDLLKNSNSISKGLYQLMFSLAGMKVPVPSQSCKHLVESVFLILAISVDVK